jgi:hypothetical protein
MPPLTTRLTLLALMGYAHGLRPSDDVEGHCDPGEKCCIEVVGDKKCGMMNRTDGVACFGMHAGVPSDCTKGKLYWRDWKSLDAGLFVQFTRPQKVSVGPRRCAKIVITEAANVLGYVARADIELPTTHQDSVGACKDREQENSDIFKDSTGVVAHPSWFNVTGQNTSYDFDLALLNDLDWKGKNLHMTLRPNEGGNFSGIAANFSYFHFEIRACKMTEVQSDRALWQTGLMDFSAALFSLLWVTSSWAFCGGVRQWRSSREERRTGSISGGLARRTEHVQDSICPCLKASGSGLSEGMLDNLLEGSSTSLAGTPPGRRSLGANADAATGLLLAAKAEVGSTLRAKKKLERDLKRLGDGDEDNLTRDKLKLAIRLAGRDIVIERRRRVGAWRKKFMAEHRFTWPYYVWNEPDSTILRVAGLRALQYMEFQWAIIRLLIGLSLPTMALLVLNLSGSWCQADSTKQEMTELDQKWGIKLIDGIGGGGNTTDYGKPTHFSNK